MIKLRISEIKQSRFYIVIVLITFIIYGNSINNEYSLDDNIVVDGVIKMNDGLGNFSKIFTSHYAKDKKQAYAYRPFATLTFAIEKQFFSQLPEKQTLEEKERNDKLTQANISHFINVLLYALTGIVLFNFLLLLLKDYNQLLPLLITLLFIVHPLHTEPVSNIKSRDELLMFLGILLALTNYLKFSFSSSYKYLVFACLSVLLAFLSKKTALALVGIVPVVLYFSNVNFKKILISTATIFGLILFVSLMKKGLVTAPSMRELKFFENPLFMEGDIMDRIALGLYCSLFYLKSLIFPKDMSFYYGYNHIPIVNWSFYQVWLAILFYVPLLGYGMWLFLKRNVLGLGIVLWLGVMFAYLNIISPVVGIVADRFTYVFSLGFSIALISFFMSIFKVPILASQIKPQVSYKFIATISLIIIGFSARTISRNSDWENYLTLFYHDIEIVDNSAKAHSMLANYLFPIALNNYEKEEFNEQVDDIIYHYTRAIEIDSTYTTSLNNLGSAYTTFKKDYKKGISLTMKAIETDSNFTRGYFSLAKTYELLNQADSSYKYYLKSITTDIYMENDIQAFTNFSFENSMISSGLRDLLLYEKTEGGSESIYLNIANLYATNTINTNESIIYFVKAFEENPKNLIVCNHIAKLYKSINDMENWNYYNTLGKSLEK